MQTITIKSIESHSKLNTFKTDLSHTELHSVTNYSMVPQYFNEKEILNFNLILYVKYLN